MRKLLTFPDPVNETAARVVAGGVAVACVVAIATQARWLTAVIAYGFLARVATGPRLSPLGQLVTRIVVPGFSLRVRLVPGPPKRFAQAIGLVFSLGAAVLSLGFDMDTAAFTLLAVLAFFATLEAALGLCVGCRAFSVLMRAGLIPSTVCARCARIGMPQAHRV